MERLGGKLDLIPALIMDTNRLKVLSLRASKSKINLCHLIHAAMDKFSLFKGHTGLFSLPQIETFQKLAQMHRDPSPPFQYTWPKCYLTSHSTNLLIVFLSARMKKTIINFFIKIFKSYRGYDSNLGPVSISFYFFFSENTSKINVNGKWEIAPGGQVKALFSPQWVGREGIDEMHLYHHFESPTSP